MRLTFNVIGACLLTAGSAFAGPGPAVIKQDVVAKRETVAKINPAVFSCTMKKNPPPPGGFAAAEATLTVTSGTVVFGKNIEIRQGAVATGKVLANVCSDVFKGKTTHTEFPIFDGVAGVCNATITANACIVAPMPH